MSSRYVLDRQHVVYVLDRQHVVHVHARLVDMNDCLTACGRTVRPTFIDNPRDWHTRCADCFDKEDAK